MPSPSVPNGYAVLSAIFQVDTATRTPTITLGVQVDALLTAAQVNTRWRSAISGVSAPFVAGNMPSTLTLSETRVLMNVGGNLFTDVDITPVVGTAATSVPPMNTAVLVNKVTGLAGRKYRGRMFTPPTFAESLLSAAGLIAGATVTGQQTAWTNVFTSLTGNDLNPCLIHGDGTAPTLLTSFVVSERIGTIGRRLRR